MKKFLSFLEENFLTEGIESNHNGVIHELLVGKYLSGGEHMKRLRSSNGESPEEVHDKIRDQMHPAHYAESDRRAAATAKHLQKHFKREGKDISKVSWTSKPGDIEKVTGHKIGQHENPSDIVVHHSDGTHTGVSLKVSNTLNKEIPTRNLGLEASDSILGAHGKELLQQHRQEIAKKHPTFGSKFRVERKGYAKINPKAKSEADDINRRALDSIASHYHHVYSQMPTDKLSHFMRHSLLHAHEEHNLPHIRTTTRGTGGQYTHDTIKPVTHYDDVLNNHKHFTVDKTGNAVTIKHRGRPILRQHFKLNNNDDPMSPVKSIATVNHANIF